MRIKLTNKQEQTYYSSPVTSHSVAVWTLPFLSFFSEPFWVSALKSNGQPETGQIPVPDDGRGKPTPSSGS